MPKTYNDKACADCRDGEHDNYSETVYRVVMRDPDDGNKVVKRSYMCADHVEMYLQDGYSVKDAETGEDL